MAFRLYVDEDALAVALVQALRSRGIDIVTTTEVGLGGYSDDQQLDYATSQERVLYSFNVRDFSALHRRYLERGVSHAGIIVAHQKRYSIGEQMRRLLNLMEAKATEEIRDK